MASKRDNLWSIDLDEEVVSRCVLAILFLVICSTIYSLKLTSKSSSNGKDTFRLAILSRDVGNWMKDRYYPVELDSDCYNCTTTMVWVVQTRHLWCLQRTTLTGPKLAEPYRCLYIDCHKFDSNIFFFNIYSNFSRIESSLYDSTYIVSHSM